MWCGLAFPPTKRFLGSFTSPGGAERARTQSGAEPARAPVRAGGAPGAPGGQGWSPEPSRRFRPVPHAARPLLLKSDLRGERKPAPTSTHILTGGPRRPREASGGPQHRRPCRQPPGSRRPRASARAALPEPPTAPHGHPRPARPAGPEPRALPQHLPPRTPSGRRAGNVGARTKGRKARPSARPGLRWQPRSLPPRGSRTSRGPPCRRLARTRAGPTRGLRARALQPPGRAHAPLLGEGSGRGRACSLSPGLPPTEGWTWRSEPCGVLPGFTWRGGGPRGNPAWPGAVTREAALVPLCALL